MRIAIVNDIELEIEVLRRTLKMHQEYDIIWTAKNGKEAIEKFQYIKPDLILMNLTMPLMDGSTATREIMKISPVAILIVTTSVSGNQGKVFEAMGYGALDVVSTPVLSPTGEVIGADDLIKKIEIFKKLINYHKVVPKNISKFSDNSQRTRLIAIGASTGGPKALSQIIEKIPFDIPAAIVIIQHVDAQFAIGLADWLTNYSSMPVKIAENCKSPDNGNIYVASTNDHLYLNSSGKFEYASEPLENHFRPSVDVFFNSLQANWIYPDVAVLLTGMGSDGAYGLRQLKKSGWHTIAQDEETSVVYGMPKAAKELNAASEILPIGEIADAIIKKIYLRRDNV
ncbi:MAG: chemotaxis-specific protein-glutamate methyltransferase CheB [Candidatus Kapabacteria bacterium]|nr:chemotaxis-specific protein-glutamate methyltransferase CheB [Ignavibacteriota bacterium]MCW5886026.1 chemotaxis-specific protein-glutamate methyltransferase CheB [Candidatus Kapabacteria bacterium]